MESYKQLPPLFKLPPSNDKSLNGYWWFLCKYEGYNRYDGRFIFSDSKQCNNSWLIKNQSNEENIPFSNLTCYVILILNSKIQGFVFEGSYYNISTKKLILTKNFKQNMRG